MAKRNSSKRSKKSKRNRQQRKKITGSPGIQQSGPVQISSRAAFERYLEQDQPVIVDFWAPWCGPCRAMAPTFEKVAKEYEGQVHFLKVNTETVPELAGAFGIRSIPTLIVLDGSEVINSHIGLTDESALGRMARKALERSQGITWSSKLKGLFAKSKEQAVQAGG